MEIGANVDTLRVGDHVAIEPGTACGHCRQCRNGSYNLCPKMKFRSVAPHDGKKHGQSNGNIFRYAS